MLINIVLISSNDISRAGLAHFLESDCFKVVASQRSACPLLDVDADTRFLAVVDLPTPEEQFEAIGNLTSSHPHAVCAILAEKFDLDAMMECFHRGAQAYILKSMRSMPLVASLRLAALGERVLPADLIEFLGCKSLNLQSPAEAESELRIANLSPRETDVLCCLMGGYPNKVIARELDVCEATVKVHVKAILRKLNVQNRTQAAIWGSAHNISDNHVGQ